MSTVNLLGPIQFPAFFANLKAIDHIEKGLVGVGNFPRHEYRVVVVFPLGGGQHHQDGILDGNDGNNSLEKELWVNVSRLINDANVGPHTTCGLGKGRGRVRGG